ncbi:hypothetical protein OROHE_009243 [Orobanche hederae]
MSMMEKSEEAKRKISEEHDDYDAGETLDLDYDSSPNSDDPDFLTGENVDPGYDSNTDAYPPDSDYIDPDLLTNEMILSWCHMEEDRPKDLGVLDAVRKYLKQIETRKGFDIIDFPGGISGVTPIYPSDYIITKRELYPEQFANVKSMATKAIEKYNRHNPDTVFEVMEIEKLNMSYSKVDVNYITFSAKNVKAGEVNPTGAIETFQAQVADDCIDKIQEVYFCRRKPK